MSLCNLRQVRIGALVLGILVAGGSQRAFGEDVTPVHAAMRNRIQASVRQYLDAHTHDGVLKEHDSVADKDLDLYFREFGGFPIHAGDSFTQLARFGDAEGRTIELRFTVTPDGETFHVADDGIYSVDGKERWQPRTPNKDEAAQEHSEPSDGPHTIHRQHHGESSSGH